MKYRPIAISAGGTGVALAMTSNFRLRWIRLCGVVALALIIFAYFLPPGLEGLRTGHWEVEHFLAYFAATSIICLGWRRPFAVAVTLVAAAALLEALQLLTPNHSANLLAVLTGAAGALTAALAAKLILTVQTRHASLVNRVTSLRVQSR
jgi:VanZ family protein